MQPTIDNERTIMIGNQENVSVVAELLDNIIDMVCNRCISPTLCDYVVDRFGIGDRTAFRCSHSATNNGEKILVIDSSDSDSSDDEFERIMGSTRRQSSLQQDCGDDDDDDMEYVVSRKTNAKLIEHEYDTLPAIEELRIHVEEDIPLEQFGKIVNIVDRLVVIEADSNTALDFDTVIFDGKRNAVGRVFDIFGPVAKPLYAILFNNVGEANKWRVDSAVYYAPTAERFTHKIFTEKLRQEKATDGSWDGEGECPDDMLAFSDDEAEQRYKAKHRSVKVRDGDKHTRGSFHSKRARYSTSGRSRSRNVGGQNIGQQFRNGSECNPYDSRAAQSNWEQYSAHQACFWPPSASRDSHYMRISGLTPFRASQHLSQSSFEANWNPRQQLSFQPRSRGDKMRFGRFSR